MGRIDTRDRVRTIAPVPATPRPAGASVPTDAPVRACTTTALQGAVEVLPDGAGRLGLLTYKVPEGLPVRVGDAVDVPFGAQVRHGIVVGPSPTPQKATKEILAVLGRRADPRDVDLARRVATYHFAELSTVLGRLSPTNGRGADPLVADTVDLTETARIPVHGVAGAPRRLLIRPPLVSGEALAAQEAARLARTTPTGQVLILCPTTRSVAAVTAAFSAGAARLDSRARAGAWAGMLAGTVRVGVGTRAAALYSVANLAGIVVVDEDHPGHLEASQPHTHARDIASARARALGVPLVLISANPTPAALGAGVVVGTAGTRSDWPRMRLIDRGTMDPVQRWAPPALRAAIVAENRAGRTPWVLAQRRTASRRCGRCGAPRPCPLCESSLCRHPAEACPRCADCAPPRMVGWDAARITDLIDGPSAQAAGRRASVRVVTAAELANARDVGLVVLFDVDAALGMAELIPQASACSLVMAAAQAAGRDGTVIALTDDPSAAALADLFGPRDQVAVARRALAAAKAAGLPPFGRLVTVRCGQEAPPKVQGWPGRVSGPAKVGADWEVLVRIEAERLLELDKPLARLRRGGKVRVTVG